MTSKSSIFEETYQNYLAQLAEVDLASRADILGMEIKDGEAWVP